MPYSKNRDFSNIELLKDKCRYMEALQELENIEKSENLSPYEQISCYVLKSSLLFELGNYRKALIVIDHLLQEILEPKYNFTLIDIFIIKSQILWRQGKLKEALNLIASSEDLLKSIQHENPMEVNKRKAKIADIKGWIYIYEGEINKATESMEYSFKLREVAGDRGDIALSYYLKGNIYFYYKIDWEHSKKCIQKAFDLAKEKDFKSLMSLCLIRLGDFYHIKGDLKRTFELYNQGFDLAKDIEYKKGIAFSLGGLAYLYEQQGNLNQALEFADQCVSTYQEMGDIFGMIENLDSSFWITLNNNDLERTKYYFNRMEQLIEQFNVKTMKIFFQLNKALFLNTSPIPSNQVKAKEILMGIIREKKMFEAAIFFEATYRALLTLCDLLLNELRNTHNLELLNDIQSCITQILDLSRSSNSFWWLAESYLLQAKLELLMLDLKKAKISITQAQEITEKYGLIHLNERVLVEQRELHEQLNKLELLRNSKAQINELIDLAQIEDQLIRMLKRRYSLE